VVAVPTLTVLRLGFASVWIVAFAYVAIASRDFPSISGMYPMVVAIAGLVLAVVTLLVDLRAWRRTGDVVGRDADNSATAALTASGEMTVGQSFRRAGRFGLWLVGLMLLIYVIGFVPAAGVFILAFLIVEADAKWPLIVVGPIVTIALLLLLANAINLYWPESLITIVE
jgi:hypothetical protein